jgi:hypothetical protein
MNRRGLILGTTATALASPLHAAEKLLGGHKSSGVRRRVWVENPKLIQQECPLWCWAASISMIFANLGHVIDQKQIVERVFGGLVCEPAETGRTMAYALSDKWTDVLGLTFQSKVVAAYDQMAGVNRIKNSFIIDELRSNRALLYANRDHAMVVTAVEYIDKPAGPNVYRVGVLDPFPGNKSFRSLTPLEMVPAYFGGHMTFLAAVHLMEPEHTEAMAKG